MLAPFAYVATTQASQVCDRVLRHNQNNRSSFPILSLTRNDMPFILRNYISRINVVVVAEQAYFDSYGATT